VDLDVLDRDFLLALAAVAVERISVQKRMDRHINCNRRVLNSPPDHGPFSVLKDEKKRAAWDADALSMFRRAKYTVIAACVDKVAWYWQCARESATTRPIGIFASTKKKMRSPGTIWDRARFA
jgi:hypothetical protein